MDNRKKLIGDRAFYGKVLGVTVPIMIQNGITNFVGLLDNIMVGRIGTEQMSGIAIVNQLLMVFSLAIFGAISGWAFWRAVFWLQEPGGRPPYPSLQDLCVPGDFGAGHPCAGVGRGTADTDVSARGGQ